MFVTIDFKFNATTSLRILLNGIKLIRLIQRNICSHWLAFEMRFLFLNEFAK